MAAIVKTPLRVRYQETDQMGVVYHTNYLVWFEIGRTEWLRQQTGVAYHELEKMGLLLPVLDIHARYHHPAKYDDELSVETSLSAVRSSMIQFAYAVCKKGENKPLVTGETKHMWVDRDWKPVRFQQSHPELYEKIISLQTST